MRDHPDEGYVGDFVVWLPSSYIAVMAWEPGLDECWVDGGAVGAACEFCVWVAPPEGWGEGGAVFVEAEGLEGEFDACADNQSVLQSKSHRGGGQYSRSGNCVSKNFHF